MGNFELNQTLLTEIMSFNHPPENLKESKILDPYLRELLVQQDKYVCLNQNKYFFCAWAPRKNMDYNGS